MKHTTIMVEEELLYEIKQIAQQQQKSASSVIREALSVYVIDQHKLTPPENPLLSIVGLGASEDPMDLSDGGDEVLLSVAYHRQWQNTLERDITTVSISTEEIMTLTREDVHLITP